jgi:hypothetical protein
MVHDSRLKLQDLGSDLGADVLGNIMEGNSVAFIHPMSQLYVVAAMSNTLELVLRPVVEHIE